MLFNIKLFVYVRFIYTVLAYPPIIWEGMIYIYTILYFYVNLVLQKKIQIRIDISMLIKLGLILLSQFSYLELTSATTVRPDVQ